ncbi:thiamine pyrophosphate enzyme protein [Rutstroemia sp. NJR-2017a BBW]|nr:thiamine pyrophosphate enzyme protein [Rutstroemia sp. NJR-2017a BBW]
MASTTNSNYTASDAFFEALAEFGVQACFVNLGSDHPSLIESMLKGQQEKKPHFPAIYTCPNEMVALSMADGWARATGRVQAVIVHVDVGTQALGAAMHDANTGRAPVLIFAGLCPYSEDGQLLGSRTEYQHWLQNIPDQKALVRGYCRYVGEFHTGSTVKQTVARALQFATSDPKGPVYIAGAREVMAEATEPYSMDTSKYVPIGPSALPDSAVETIAESLLKAKSPLIVTGYSGRNHSCPAELVKLTDNVPGLRVLDTGGCDMCFPATHPSSLGFRLSFDQATTNADVIFVLDCDVPWIPSRNKPREDTLIYHVDVDPLNSTMDISFFPAHGRWKADSYTALTQINKYLNSTAVEHLRLPETEAQKRHAILVQQHEQRMSSIDDLATPGPSDLLDIHYVSAAIKDAVPDDAIFVVEAATCAMSFSDQLKADIPGSWINSGGAGLGWSGGAAMGVKLAYDAAGKPKFVCQVTGDGTYLFSVPSSVYWTASRYGIPVLTIVLNNRGWNAPRQSYKLVHPTGLGATSTNKDMHMSLDPSPDYSGIAKAAAGENFGSLKGGLFAGKATTTAELKDVLERAVREVQSGRGAVVEVVLGVDEQGNSNI